MNSREAIKLTINMGEVVAQSYLGDLTDEQLMLRPHASCNHLNWQVGHLIVSEHHHLEKIMPGAAPPLPAGFAERYSKETSSSNNPSQFARKDELLRVHAQQLAAVLAALDKTSDADLDRPSGVEYAPNVGAIFALQGNHWLMHAGQWVIVRRELGKPALF